MKLTEQAHAIAGEWDILGKIKRNYTVGKSAYRGQRFGIPMAVVMMMYLSTNDLLAQASAGAGAFTNATTEIKRYQEPVRNLMYAIAAVIAIVGAFNIFFKMQNGDQDVKKTIMLVLGGCIAFVCAATALPLFFE